MTQTSNHYRGEAGRRYHFEKRGIPEAAYRWLANLRAAKFAGLVQPDDVVFEFGVGAGWNLAALTCARRLGHDIAEFLAVNLSRHGIEYVADTALLGDAAMDVAICHHALEHVLEPAKVLAELRRLLRPGGRLLVAVPFEKERRYRRFRPAEPNHHLYSWNPQTLGNLIGETGFELRQTQLARFGYERFAASWAHQLRMGETGFRLLHALAHLLQPGHEVRAVAVKPRG